jgi:hypothetical protein
MASRLRRWVKGDDPVVFCVFDLLVRNGESLTDLPIQERKAHFFLELLDPMATSSTWARESKAPFDQCEVPINRTLSSAATAPVNARDQLAWAIRLPVTCRLRRDGTRQTLHQRLDQEPLQGQDLTYLVSVNG